MHVPQKNARHFASIFTPPACLLQNSVGEILQERRRTAPMTEVFTDGDEEPLRFRRAP
jgi:hypothetical protein